MGHLIITNKFELGMIEETCNPTKGVAIGMPEKQDIQNLIKEYFVRDYHKIHVHFQARGTYESSHEGYYFREAINHLTYPERLMMHPSPFPFTSHIFGDKDHILILQNCYDPVFSEDEYSFDFIKTYLISF